MSTDVQLHELFSVAHSRADVDEPGQDPSPVSRHAPHLRSVTRLEGQEFRSVAFGEGAGPEVSFLRPHPAEATEVRSHNRRATQANGTSHAENDAKTNRKTHKGMHARACLRPVAPSRTGFESAAERQQSD